MKLDALRLAIALVFLGVPSSIWAQLELQYQQLGDPYEGVKLKPVLGCDFELISVLADYQESHKR